MSARLEPLRGGAGTGVFARRAAPAGDRVAAGAVLSASCRGGVCTIDLAYDPPHRSTGDAARAEHWFGTDNTGRDILPRHMHTRTLMLGWLA
jgi:ABC-type dipeptide/oligopeptide/nickel transport system permease subunit